MGRKPKIASEKISFRVTADEKRMIERLAMLAGKTITDFGKGAMMEMNLDTAKVEFYQSINDNLLELKRSNYVLTRLVMLLGTQVLKDEEGVIAFFKDISKEAEAKIQ